MTVIATASNPRFSVSRVDIDRPGPTYTIDTLRDLRAAARAGRRVLLHHRRRRAGADHDLAGCGRTVQAGAFRRLHPARAPPERRRPARRPGEPDRDPRAGHLLDHCRQRVEAGEPIWYLVPDGIVQYISKRSLYRKADADPGRS